MANPIQEAFKAVKKDIFTLKDRINKNKDSLEEIKKEISKIDINKFSKKLDKFTSKMENKLNSLQEDNDFEAIEDQLSQRIDNANELTEEKFTKEISQLKRRLTLIEKKKDDSKILYKKGISKEKEVDKIMDKEVPEPWEEDDKKKKKGFFKKIIDFLTEED